MKSLEQLIEKYQNNPSLETQQAISKFYIKNKDNRDQIGQNLLDFFTKDNLKGGLEWYSFFEGDKKFWNQVFLVVEEKNAQKFLQHVKLHQEKNNEVYLDFAVDMCDSSASSVIEVKNMPQQVEALWVKVFQEFPDFSQKIEENKKLKQERLETYIKSLNIPVTQVPITIKTLEITVPIISMQGKSIDFEKLEKLPAYSEFMQDRVDFFNNFHLQGYMNIPACHKITLSIENHQNVFKLELNDEVDLSRLKKELLGQLSDGLGSNLAQQPLLIQDKMYYFDFDIKNASEFFEVNKQSQNKRKI